MRNSKSKTIVACLIASMAMGVAQAQTSSAKTVDELLTLENQKLLEQERRASGTAPSASTGVQKPVVPTVSVQSIFGTEGAMRADLTFNGVSHEGIKVGSRIGSCVVTAVADRCVVLTPVAVKKTSASQCPKACWTGQPVFQPSADLPAGSSKSPLPAGFPGMSATAQ